MGLLSDIVKMFENMFNKSVKGSVENFITNNGKCPKCKKKIANKKAKHCPNCGFKLVVTCNKCKKEHPHTAKYCEICGGRLRK
ncbi:hypothetical protein KO465_05295 [Candidatus Micrarchaeota archaeon]|nr:hypothetical protein [Candidatus Micrarchaeota archaeon]